MAELSEPEHQHQQWTYASEKTWTATTSFLILLLLTIGVCAGCRSRRHQKEAPSSVIGQLPKRRKPSTMSSIKTKTEYTMSAVTMPSGCDFTGLSNTNAPAKANLQAAVQHSHDQSKLPDLQLLSLRGNEIDKSASYTSPHINVGAKKEQPSLRMTSMRQATNADRSLPSSKPQSSKVNEESGADSKKGSNKPQTSSAKDNGKEKQTEKQSVTIEKPSLEQKPKQAGGKHGKKTKEKLSKDQTSGSTNLKQSPQSQEASSQGKSKPSKKDKKQESPKQTEPKSVSIRKTERPK